MGIWKLPVLYEDCMEPGRIGKSNTNNLLAPTDLTENPYGKKTFYQKVLKLGANEASDQGLQNAL